MDTTPEYEVLALALSTTGTVLSSLYLWRVIRSYQEFHDERAAISLSKAIGLLVISIGMLLSAVSLWVDHGSFASAGLMISRGALLATMATLVLTAVRPGMTRDD